MNRMELKPWEKNVLDCLKGELDELTPHGLLDFLQKKLFCVCLLKEILELFLFRSDMCLQMVPSA